MCPICGDPAGFHNDTCYGYTLVTPELTRPPGADAFKAWRAEATKAKETQHG